jgi:hypothetical protein
MATRKKPNATATGVAVATIAETVAAYFAANAKTPEVYSTSDGYLFEVKKFAKDHARTLSDAEEPETHSNPLVAVPEPNEELDEADDDNTAE